MGMNVPGGNSQHNRGDSLSGEMQGCRVRSAGTAHRQLEWDARIQSRFFGQGGQPGIGDGRGVKQPDLHASTQGPLGIRHGKPGGVVCRRPFQNNHAIRLHGDAGRPGAPRAYLLLNRRGGNQGVGMPFPA